MDDPRIRLTHDSLTLLAAGERLQQGAGDRACAAFLPASLDCVEQACARSSNLVAATMEAPASIAELEHRSSTPKAA